MKNNFEQENEFEHKTEEIFFCESCNYSTKRCSQWERHILTPKHKDKNNFICDCGKKYMHKSGLYKHKQKNKCINIEKENNSQELIKTILRENNRVNEEVIKTILKENQEVKQLLIEQNEKIMEMAKNSNTTINNNTNNTNNFNLQLFLNVECKDALNITDFLDSLQIEIKDLEETGRLGFVKGVSKILLDRLKKMDVNMRPIHCSDVKRETIYVKDNNAWEKEDDEKEKLKLIVRTITDKNIKKIPQWQQEHPGCCISTSKSNDKYLRILINIINGSTDEERDHNYKKIFSILAKEFVINKDKNLVTV